MNSEKGCTERTSFISSSYTARSINFTETSASPLAQVTLFRFPIGFPPLAVPPPTLPLAAAALPGTFAGELDDRGSRLSFIALTISAKGSAADGSATSSPLSALGVAGFAGGGIGAFLNDGSFVFLGAEKNDVSVPAPFADAAADDDDDSVALEDDSFLTLGFVDVEVPTAGFLDGGAPLPDAALPLEFDVDADDAEGGSFRFFEPAAPHTTTHSSVGKRIEKTKSKYRFAQKRAE